MTEGWPLRWDLLLRYRLIEIVALWEGRLTTNHLCKSFGIGRQQASKDINNYLREIAPGNLEYDSSIKGYKPTAAFKPAVTTGKAEEYLHLLSRNQDIAERFQGLDLGFTRTEMLQVPLREVQPQLLRPLVQACREGSRIEVKYLSLQNPTPRSRIIAPHTLVYTPNRWHLRAWCEQNGEFRDFVLSRFRGTVKLLSRSEKTAEHDDYWNAIIPVRIVPDSRLGKAQQAVIEADYGMTDGQLVLETRASLVEYLLQALNIDTRSVAASPEAQQIVVGNLEQVDKWRF
ncbi:YafY family protein [Pseudomaricurvus sp. HS19]|uniref:helix-turn-helix transcriptional regulator n=1 Tax=Pseudomaricurvus sp. HS19 TaxID=2692626 RepID=UPI00136BBABB|nr:WYL domain-containing protein [Pseudomaricurvus sp. HS19]MYM62353.1 WYL domain-containing protein [Pseudomaricurvus sp. HS19]